MLPELKITQLRHFVWVTELKGFHNAAEKACRTQPAISLSIRDLENKLGSKVFEKRNAKTTLTELTPFGKHFLPRAKELIAHHDSVAQDMNLMREHKAGHLRLASVPSIAVRILPDIISGFVADSPNLHISFFDDNSEAVLRKVEKQQVDLGIASLPDVQEHKGLVFTPIWQDHIGVVCHVDHPLAGAQSLDWKDLRQHRLISNGTTRLLADTEAASLMKNSQFFVSNMLSLIALLEAGIGISTLPRFAFPQDNKKLIFIPLSNPQVIRDIGMVYRKQIIKPSSASVT